MTKASKTVYYFGFYLLATGLTLIFMPNLLLATFGIESTSEVWIRVVGALALAIGIYYIFTASTNNETFLKLTVYNRVLIAVWFSLFVAMGWAQWQLLLFGGVDLLGALWTWSAMRR
jgi:protein-S-isoprenylcysteine O-methyltransferase Ste14